MVFLMYYEHQSYGSLKYALARPNKHWQDAIPIPKECYIQYQHQLI